MKPGDLVRLIPDEPDRYDGLVGMILWEEDGRHLLVDDTQEVRFFRIMVNGSSYWKMPEDRLEPIDGS